MTKRAEHIFELIGNTPLVRLQRMAGEGAADLLVKLEFCNPGGSIKDRIALAMIEDAEGRGVLRKGAAIIEPTSGNTGIGLAMVAAARGYHCILVMPETMSVERRQILASYGAEIVLTPGTDGMAGAVTAAEALHRARPGSFMPGQFRNPANPAIHRRTTAVEILAQTGGRIDAFVAGVGTGGTLTGVGEVLKERIPGVLVIAVEPAKSAVLAGGKPGPHKIQGIGAGFVPAVLNRAIIDRIIPIEDDEAYRTAKRVAKEEGILIGYSAGAAVAAACAIARELGRGKTVVTIAPDSGERYLSMDTLFNQNT